MQFITEETKSGWLTKLGGNALRKTWKRRFFEIRGDNLYYYRQQGAVEPAGIIHLSSYNTVVQDPTVTKKSPHCIRVEKVARSSDSTRSALSYREVKTPVAFIAYADTEQEMHQWLSILQKRVGERNIVDIVLDRLDLAPGGHRRQGSYGSLSSLYSHNGGSSSTLSSRRPSLDSLSLGTPSLDSHDSRKSSIDSLNSGYRNGERPITPQSQQIAPSPQPTSSIGQMLGQPIIRKVPSHSCVHDRRSNIRTRKVSLTLKGPSSELQQHKAPVIMIHGDGSKYTSPDAIYFPEREVKIRRSTTCDTTKADQQGRKNHLDSFDTFSSTLGLNTSNIHSRHRHSEDMSGSPVTPIRNIFPSHLSDDK